MPWPQSFIDQLDRPNIEPRYVLESFQVGSFAPTSSPLKLSSFDQPGYRNCITREGSSVQHGAITPGTWERTYGSISIGCGTTDVRAMVSRGMVVRLLVGHAATSDRVSDFECVGLYSVRNVLYEQGRWRIVGTELAGCLQNRFDRSVDQQNLFFDLPFKTKLSADYDPGVSSSLDVNADGSGSTPNGNPAFEASDTGDFCCRVNPSDGNPYYVTGTTFGSSSLSGSLDDGAFDSPLTQRDPPTIGTPHFAATGDRVEAVAWLHGHPLDLVYQILVSTGVPGDNGPDDVLPQSWSYSIRYGLVDRDDIDAFIKLTTSYSWDVLVDHSQTDAQAWFTELLRPAGMFLGTHQGCLTARAVVRYQGAKTPGTVSISDDDIVSIDEYQTWDDLAPIEYNTEKTFAYNEADVYNFTEDNLQTRPVRVRRRRDLLNVFQSGGHSADWTFEVSARLGPYDTRVPERFKLTLRGWKTAVASLGDIVFVTTEFLTMRTNSHQSSDLTGTPCLVVGGGPNWFGATSQLELIHLPQFGGLE